MEDLLDRDARSAISDGCDVTTTATAEADEIADLDHHEDQTAPFTAD